MATQSAPAFADNDIDPVEVPRLTLFLSTDGKHTVNVSGPLEDAQRIVAEAQAVYDDILSKYGAKPAPTYGGGARPPQRPKSAPPQNVDVFCADCGGEIKGFTDAAGKDVPAQVIAAARLRKLGRVTCGKDGCKNGSGRDF